MENIENCLVIAINELGKINFSGGTLIPAGKVMQALQLAAQEVERLKAEEQDRLAEAKEERPEEEKEADDGEN